MRRPFLWILGSFLFLILFISVFPDDTIEKREYILPTEDDSVIPAVLTGTLERYEIKPKSNYLYLKSVTVSIADSWYKTHPHSPKQKYSFSDFLVVTKESCEQKFFTGNLLCVQGEIGTFSRATNPGNFDERDYYREKNIYYRMRASAISVSDSKKAMIKCALLSFRQRILSVYKQSLNSTDCGTISAMLFGEKADMELSVRELYSKSGIGHLLSISGLHISILCLFFSFLLSVLPVPAKMNFMLTTVFLYSYGFMAGLSVSVNRAILMMLLLLFSRIVSRSYDALTAMAVSAMIILLQRPYALFSAGFLLSYSAVFGVIYVTPVLKGVIEGTVEEQEISDKRKKRKERERIKKFRIPFALQLLYKLKNTIESAFLCSLAVTITTLPVTLYFFYEIPTYSIFLNVLLIPLASVLILISMTGGIIGVFFLPLAKGILGLSHLILSFYTMCCEFFQRLPKPVLILGCPETWQIFVYCILFFAILYFAGMVIRYRQKFPLCCKSGFLICFLLALFFLCVRVPERGVSITVLDVGQGDGIVLQTQEKKTVLIDGGSTSEAAVGKYRILPFLKYKGIQKLDYLIMTHEDEDHISGQLELLEESPKNGIQIGMLLMPEPSDTSVGKNYREMKAAARKANVPVRYIHKGDLLRMDSMSLSCLHPEKGFPAESANAYSTTLRLAYGKFSMLFTGDLEKSGEEAVLPLLKKTTVLKVAHHGSKNSSSEKYLSLLSPKLAVISCGHKNRYGHPHKELLERLKAVHARVVRTDREGAVLIRSDGKTWSVKN